MGSTIGGKESKRLMDTNRDGGPIVIGGDGCGWRGERGGEAWDEEMRRSGPPYLRDPGRRRPLDPTLASSTAEYNTIRHPMTIYWRRS
jgi:hypothetical protein